MPTYYMKSQTLFQSQEPRILTITDILGRERDTAAEPQWPEAAVDQAGGQRTNGE